MNELPEPPSSDSDFVDFRTIKGSYAFEDRVREAIGDARSDKRATIRALKIFGANGLNIRLERDSQQTVGRAKFADITVSTDGMLSRKHLSFECTGDQALVRDLGSMNGTFVNGRRVQLARLGNHDQVIAGSTVFTVQIEYEDD